MRDMDRSLGDGGMPLMTTFGVTFARYGEGWVEAAFHPTELACNPAGAVQGGVYAVVHDAAMNFAANSALVAGDRTATLDVSYQILRPASAGDELVARGEVLRAARATAFVTSTITVAETGEIVSRAHGTFAVRRREG